MSQTTKKGPGDILGQLAIGLLVIAAFVWLMQAGKAPMQVLVRRDCENRYLQARTSADTVAVDHQVSPLLQRDTAGKTCGALRAAGALH